MSWKKQRRLQGRNKYYSLSKKLRREKKSNDQFEVMLSQLTLEEVIGLNKIDNYFSDLEIDKIEKM
jgi:hypothetical protein